MSSTVRLLVSALQRKWKWPAARPHPLSRTHRDFSAKHSPENSDASQQSSLIDPPLLSPVQTCLALSVHFLHPKLGMKDYEILSRATAFLLNVDPLEEQIYSPDDISDALNNKNGTQTTGRQTKSAFPHLASNQSKRDAMAHKQDYAFEPAAGPKRHAHELNWLEFTPPNFRPRVHVMASSHVLSPWMWPQYYGQDWLKMVEQEHVRYSLEVYGCKENGGSVQEGKLDGKFEPIAKFALNPYPIHHPNGLDVAVIHLKGEDEALKHMKSMGIQTLNLHTTHQLDNTTDPVFEPGENVYFHGFEVCQENKVDMDDNLSSESDMKQEDDRIFHPYFSSGVQSYGSPDRFLAKTPDALPEGLCGGPVLTSQHDNRSPLYIRGIVEGIVPTTHDNSEFAGSASFLPSYRVREFIDFAERIMLQQIIEPGMFQRVVNMKEQRAESKGTIYGDDAANDAANDAGKSSDDEITDPNILANMEGISETEDTPTIDKAYQEIVSSLHKHHTPEEVDAILATVERERKEVIDIMEKEGGDMDDVIANVRKRTYEERDRILKEMRDEVEEGEIVKDEKST